MREGMGRTIDEIRDNIGDKRTEFRLVPRKDSGEDLVKLQHAPLDEINDTARSADHDINTPADLANLCANFSTYGAQEHYIR